MKLLRNILAILVFVILPANRLFPCGTVESWTVEYFKSNDANNQYTALTMIHCEPVLSNEYDASKKQHELLAKLIENALNKQNKCFNHLAIKNFFVFDRLFQIEDDSIYNRITKTIESKINRNVNDITGSIALFNFEEQSDYCKKVDMEIDQIIHKGTISTHGKGGTKLVKDVSFFNQQISVMEEFKQKTKKHLLDDKEYEVIQVKNPSLKFREKESTKSAMLLLIKPHKNGWYYVVDENGTKGWVSGEYTQPISFKKLVKETITNK